MSTGPSITVRVPGSTSNCGAGFDTLGLALTVYNQVTVEPVAGAEIVGRTLSDRAAQEMVVAATTHFYAATGTPARGFVYAITGDVPPARGLGSSVTVLAGIVAALNALHGSPLSRHRLTAIVTALEGHPDNAAAGVLGGFCVARCDPATGTYLDTVRVAVPAEVAFVVVSPAVEVLTKQSRGVLPATLPYFDAVRSINSATFLVAAIVTGDFAKLRHAVGDFMHEPYRLPGIPGGRPAISAGIAAGAYTGWLSGSGSSVLCVADHSTAAEVASAMTRAFAEAGLRSEARILRADNHGLQVV
jgi:homoserine kinase